MLSIYLSSVVLIKSESLVSFDNLTLLCFCILLRNSYGASLACLLCADFFCYGPKQYSLIWLSPYLYINLEFHGCSVKRV